MLERVEGDVLQRVALFATGTSVLLLILAVVVFQ
jgi:hypothetical protein